MIVKNILTNRIVICEKLLISSFKPKGLKTIIKNIPKDNYVIGVGYKEGDYQICISGRRKYKENIYNTVKREMYEELSILPKNDPKIVLRDERNYFSIIDLQDTVLMESISGKENSERDSQDRAIICVHGGRENISHYIANVKLRKDNTDFITHIWADTAENILKYF